MSIAYALMEMYAPLGGGCSRFVEFPPPCYGSFGTSGCGILISLSTCQYRGAPFAQVDFPSTMDDPRQWPKFVLRPLRRAANKTLPYDGLPSPSKRTTDKNVRLTAGEFFSAARLIFYPIEIRSQCLLSQIRVHPPGYVGLSMMPFAALLTDK